MALLRQVDLTVGTPLGPARVVADLAIRARGTLVLGHGAGGGIEARDLVALARELPARRLNVIRVEQPWRTAGRRVAVAPAQLDLAWTAVLDDLARTRLQWWVRPVVVGGRSAGARVGCRTAARTGADAVVALAFPLHPPGRPSATRAAELLDAAVPVLAVQGERDPFGRASDLPSVVVRRAIPYADHGFAVPARAPITQAEALDLITGTVAGWFGDGLRLAAGR